MSDTTNVLPELNKYSVLIPTLFMLLFLMTVIILLLFDKTLITSLLSRSSEQSKEEMTNNTYIILVFVTLLVVASIGFIPSFAAIKTFLTQTWWVSGVFVYTILFVLFLSLFPRNLLNDYSLFILPVLSLLTAGVFYKGSNSNYISGFNMNYERIKTMILYFCLITIVVNLYNVDPGGIIHKYLNYTSLGSIILFILMTLYLIVCVSIPDVNFGTGEVTNSLFSNFTAGSKIGLLGSLLFFVTVLYGIFKDTTAFYTDTANAISVVTLTMIVLMLNTILLFRNTPAVTGMSSETETKFLSIKGAMSMFLSIAGLGLVAGLISYYVLTLSSSNILSLILSIFVLLLTLGLLYKTYIVNTPSSKLNAKKAGFFDILISLFFYIPCVALDLFNMIVNFGTKEYNATSQRSVVALFVLMIAVAAYVGWPFLNNILQLQGGKLLLNQPVYTDTLQTLANYDQLNKHKNEANNTKFNYQFGLSFWAYFDSIPPNAGPAYNKYTSILNFGGKPNVLYNASKNTLVIVMEDVTHKTAEADNIEDIDGVAHRIIYKNTNVLLQKWNNIVINYNGGTLDIFLNGELVKSAIEVVPFMSYDTLTVGEDNGISGGVCNVNYFDTPLTATKMYYIYSTIKNETPPVIYNDNRTIIPYL